MPPVKRFRLLPHTADIGIEAWGNSRAELFDEMARGLKCIIFGDCPAGCPLQREIALEGSSDAELLVAWLNEIISPAAMAGAANFAFANRQLITFRVREAFEQVLQKSPADLRLNLIYDVCHNIAKWEEHLIDGKSRRLCVQRKGATRAFPPGHPEPPADYRQIGQPVLIPGDMGRYSYVMVGTKGAMKETFGSSCHGAGRLLSRRAAQKKARGHDIVAELAARGTLIRAAGRATVAEEFPDAYKDVAEVVEAIRQAGLGRTVARLKPLAVIKG